MLARNISLEEISSWAEYQISGKSDRYMDMDEEMRKILEELSLVRYPGFELSNGDIFLMCMKLLQ
jgi:hypothetical protein